MEWLSWITFLKALLPIGTAVAIYFKGRRDGKKKGIIVATKDCDVKINQIAMRVRAKCPDMSLDIIGVYGSKDDALRSRDTHL